jgi:ATP-dependent DNA helicase RecG
VVAWQTESYKFFGQPLADYLGPKTAKLFTPLRIHTVGDLLRQVPRRYLSGTDLTDLSSLKEGEHVAVTARVEHIERVEPSPRSKAPGRLEVTVGDGKGKLRLTYFGKTHLLDWWTRQLNSGVSGVFVGKVSRFRDQLQMSHPQFVMLDANNRVVGVYREEAREEKARLATLVESGLVGVYPATAKLQTWQIAECARILLSVLPSDDPWPAWVREGGDVVDETTAMNYVHRPVDLGQAAAGAERLRFDEAFATQLTMAYRRADAANNQAFALTRQPDGALAAFDAALPFALTDGQRQVGEDIFADLERTRPMQRLLQGEVGSGKTVVALRAMLAVHDADAQALLLAPTEVLAAQHYQTITRLLDGVEHAPEVTLLTGSMSAVTKRNIMLRIASGDAGIVIGTHALLSEKVSFFRLGLVVIDEQHRFGVEQRALIASKAGAKPHTLVLTATPIPRSVAMTVFGDLEVSTLYEVPAGRADVATVVVDSYAHPAWVDRAWERIKEEVAAGRQAFVVCPRIGGPSAEKKPKLYEDSESGKGVVELFADLQAGPLAGLRLGMLHGQMPTEDKEAAMSAFAAGKLDVLVATTVIEVGVDVPNATVMVVWDADRFGISQLHQLRGRIGRGEWPGVCLLIYDPRRENADTGKRNIDGKEEGPGVKVEAQQRLAALAATRDGFELAELDLLVRREGDVLGDRQSGTRSSLRLLRVLEHTELIEKARELAERAVREDPQCATPGFQDAVTITELLADGELMENG